MSKLDINFTDYKASGVYFIEKDNSIIDTVDVQSSRLAVGFSKKGPFNAPVYLDNSSDLAEVYGGPDTKLERNGVFFNRSLGTLITSAPTYALNLLPFDEEKYDKTTTINNVGALCVGTRPGMESEVVDTLKYQELHDTSRFWKPSSEHLEEYLPESIVNFANVGTSDFTLFVRKAEKISGYNLSARDWYGTEDQIPYAWIKPDDVMSNYFIQVICIDGDWTDRKLATDAFWKDYFVISSDGSSARLKKDKVNKFIGLSQVTVIGNYTGCIIPDFYDKTNALRSIKNIVNQYTTKTGLLCSVNEKALEEATIDTVDFVGHSIPKVIAQGEVPSCEFMSYDFTYGKDIRTSLEDASFSVNGTSIDFYEDASVLSRLTVGTMVGGIGGLTKITKKRKYGTDSSVFCTITVADSDKIYPVLGDESDEKVLYIVPSISDCYTDLKPLLVKGLDIDTKIANLFDISGDKGILIDDDGFTYMGEDVPIARIYKVLEDKGIQRGLLNRDIIDYRYIIDTMAHGLGQELGSKKFLARLAKNHERCTAFINAPSVKEFAKCPYAAYYDEDDVHRVFDAKYIPQGGNDELMKNVEFTLISEDNGSKYCAVFSPFLRCISGSKEILVPPAADVSNAFMKKFAGGDPYVTIANTNGILTSGKISGVEYEYDDTDRGYLEPFGINPIVYKAKKVMIYGDRTSFQDYISDYNYLHVRELLNTIEIECNAILQNYVFRYNNAQTRADIIKKIDPILSAMQTSGALYKYELQMDENNNTDEVIDQSFAILDLGVWITKNMEKVIARITVNKMSDDE